MNNIKLGMSILFGGLLQVVFFPAWGTLYLIGWVAHHKLGRKYPL